MEDAGTKRTRPQLIDHEWYLIENMKDFVLECCDCGLVHNISWKRKGKKLAMKLARNIEETKKARMENK